MRSTNAPLLDKDSDDSNISSIESMQNNTKWYKGLTHSHSDLSDGNSAPEFIVQWYKERGYNFLAISDHNMFDRQLFEKLSTAYNVPDKFLMLSGEELTMNVGTRDLHMNIVNICNPIEPHTEKDVVSTIKTNASNAEKQSEAFRRKILVYVNHPDWNDYAIYPEEIAGTSGVKFMEIANCLGSVNHYGNGFTGGMEKYWDIVNTIRLGKIHDSPIFGLAAD
ncbi:MAG TPA: hypothetical protein VHO84_06000, partial [Syntrophorhabdaceae bacterium]|nr:hypothetical protein [Syntrophorhabdaceae bacterium]